MKLSDKNIIAIRDKFLPSQGEPFDCLAFAHALLFAERGRIISWTAHFSPTGQGGESTDYCRGWRDVLDYIGTEASIPHDGLPSGAETEHLRGLLRECESGIEFIAGLGNPPKQDESYATDLLRRIREAIA